jgi:tRNA A37 methylthiotransferase MiaB
VPAAVKKRRGARLRADSHEACLRHWRSKVGSSDEVIVDRPGRGYGDDYSPWLLDESARVGELVSVQAIGVAEEGIIGAA